MSPYSETSTVHRLVKIFRDRGLKAGDKVPGEMEVCALLGLSRPVVREAFSVLEAAGLLVARKGSGRVLLPFGFDAVVNLLSSYAVSQNKLILDLLAVRQVIESNMLPAAAAIMKSEDLDEIEKLVEAMEEKATRNAYFGEEDRKFHALLYRGLDNEVLQGLLTLFWSMYNQLHTDTLSHSQRLDETAAHHRRIFTALKAGDIRRAQHYLDAHFYDTAFALTHGAAAAAQGEKQSQSG